MAVSAVAGLVGVASKMIAVGKFWIGWKAALGAFALGAGLSAVSRALAPKPDFGAQLRGVTQTTREPASSRKIVYGQMRVGGQVVFLEHSGSDNAYLHMVIVFASHEIESFEEFWFNDKKVYENNAVLSDWSSVVTITHFDGSQTTADSTLTSVFPSTWTSNHILNGMAYAHFKLEWDQDKFPQGVPNITAVLKGRKVYDPRAGGQSATDSSTWTYSQNPALCVRDYLVDEKYGLGEDHTLIDTTALTAAANACDEDVSLDGGGTQDRYTCNGMLDTNNQIKGNIEQILSAMGGRLTHSGGKYFIDAAGYKTPSFTFDEADCVSEVQTQTKQSRRSIYNGVKGIFVSEEKNYKVLDYPAQISSTYATEDGDPIYLDMPLPFVTNNTQAQRLAKIALLKSRQQVALTMVVNLKGLQVKIGDTIKITNERLGYSEKVFEVIDYTLTITDGSLSVSLELIETAAAIYDWTTSDEQDFLSGGVLDLYDGRTVDNVTSLAKNEIALVGPDGTSTTTVELTWTAPTDAFVDFYKVRYNVNGTTDYFHAETKETRILLTGLDVTSTYDFRVKVQNLVGVSSTGTTLTAEVFNGDTTAPAIPSNTSATGGIQTITAEWTNDDADIDYAYTLIFVETSNTQPPNYSNPTAKVAGEEYILTGLSGAVTRWFFLANVDFSGNISGFSAGFSGTSVVAQSADIADNSIGSDELADDAVGTDQIADDAVTADQIADGSVELTAFASGIQPVQVVSTLPSTASQGDMAFLTTDNKLYRYNGSAWTVAVDGGDVSTGTLPAASIVANSITAGQIAAGAISTDELAANAVTAAKITAGTITFDKLLGGVIENTTDTLASSVSISPSDGVVTIDSVTLAAPSDTTLGHKPLVIVKMEWNIIGSSNWDDDGGDLPEVRFIVNDVSGASELGQIASFYYTHHSLNDTSVSYAKHTAEMIGFFNTAITAAKTFYIKGAVTNFDGQVSQDRITVTDCDVIVAGIR